MLKCNPTEIASQLEGKRLDGNMTVIVMLVIVVIMVEVVVMLVMLMACGGWLPALKAQHQLWGDHPLPIDNSTAPGCSWGQGPYALDQCRLQIGSRPG